MEFDSSCYKVYTDSKTADAASSACAADGAHLAYVTSLAEHNFVADQLYSDTWIGLRKSGDENAYSWLDGTPLDFRNWRSGEPDNYGKKECVWMRASSNYRWADKGCYDVEYHYVCELQGKKLIL